MSTTVRMVRPFWAAILAIMTTVLVVFTFGGSSSVSLGGEASSSIQVRARGETGRELMEIRVGGNTLAQFEVATEWDDYTVDAPSAAGADNVEVAFLNDSLEGGDNNLWVDSLTYGGRTYEAEAETTYSTGVWQNGGRCRPGYHRSEQLACAGVFSFGDLPGSTPSLPFAGSTDGSTIVVSAAGETGDELLEVRIDGDAVATFELGPSPDLFANPVWEEYTYQAGEFVSGHRISVAFVNDVHRDGVDHNVRVGWVKVDGSKLDVLDETPQLLSGRPATAACVASVHRDEIMPCNSLLRFVGSDREQHSPIVTEAPAVETSTTKATAPPTTVKPKTTVAPTTVKPTTTVTPTTATPTTATPTTATPTTAKRTTVTEATVVPTTSKSADDGAKPAAASGNFYVVGKDIIDPNGNIFYPIGANVAIKFTSYGYVFEGNNGGVNNHLADVQAWNWNTIRATLICDNDSGTPSFDELVNGIHPTIERFTAAGIVVMLECHDSTGKDPRVGSSKDLRIQRFWDEMARRYSDNPYVWFNVYNEPYASADTTNWTRLHQHYVDRIRATGAENIIVMDLPVWGQGIHLLGDQSFADGLNQECNTVFGWHAYGAINGQQGSFADHESYIRKVQAKGMPVVIGEYGVAFPANYGNAGPWTWNVSGFDAMNVLGPKYGIGLLWWHATGDQAYFSLYSLKTDRSGFWTSGNSGNLTPAGADFWRVSQAVSHSRGAFQGDLRASGCSSAG